MGQRNVRKNVMFEFLFHFDDPLKAAKGAQCFHKGSEVAVLAIEI